MVCCLFAFLYHCTALYRTQLPVHLKLIQWLLGPSPSLSATRDHSTVTGLDSKSVRTRSKFIQLTVVDDINAKAVEAWKQKRSIVNDMYTLILLIQYGIYFWHELAYTLPHFLKLKSNICGNPLARNIHDLMQNARMIRWIEIINATGMKWWLFTTMNIE